MEILLDEDTLKHLPKDELIKVIVKLQKLILLFGQKTLCSELLVGRKIDAHEALAPIDCTGQLSSPLRPNVVSNGFLDEIGDSNVPKITRKRTKCLVAKEASEPPEKKSLEDFINRQVQNLANSLNESQALK